MTREKEQELKRIFKASRPNTFELMTDISNDFNIETFKLIRHNKTDGVSVQRSLAMYIFYRFGFTFKEIGMIFEGRDHSTVIWNYNQVIDILQYNDKLINAVYDSNAVKCVEITKQYKIKSVEFWQNLNMIKIFPKENETIK